MSVIMAILIIVALVVIVVTIYSRLTAIERNAESRQSEISLPVGARVSSASMDGKGQMLLLIEKDNRQQIWQFDRSGRLQRQIEIRTLALKSSLILYNPRSAFADNNSFSSGICEKLSTSKPIISGNR